MEGLPPPEPPDPKGSMAVKAVPEEMMRQVDAAEVQQMMMEKVVKKFTKKLREIRMLQAKKDSGVFLTVEEKEKLQREKQYKVDLGSANAAETAAGQATALALIACCHAVQQTEERAIAEAKDTASQPGKAAPTPLPHSTRSHSSHPDPTLKTLHSTQPPPRAATSFQCPLTRFPHCPLLRSFGGLPLPPSLASLRPP